VGLGPGGQAGRDGGPATAAAGITTRSNPARADGYEDRGAVNLLGLAPVLQAALTDHSYDLLADLNGDGVVDASEAALACNRAGLTVR
jgi:hypothetical protein